MIGFVARLIGGAVSPLVDQVRAFFGSSRFSLSPPSAWWS